MSKDIIAISILSLITGAIALFLAGFILLSLPQFLMASPLPK
jgi:hypothetical protein